MLAHRHVIQSHAARMRASLTRSEALLWERLCASQLGVGFRRQLVIGRFIVDFAAPSRRIVVEVDGGYHTSDARRRADDKRDRALERRGWRVVRVSAECVEADIERAVACVQRALEA